MDSSLFYEQLIMKFRKYVDDNNLLSEEIVVTGRTLSTEEAIGKPQRQDYPIIKGKEKLIEADFKGCKGQAFTDMPGNYSGTLKDVLEHKPDNNFERAVLIATMNAVLKYLDIIEKTIHCHDEEPEECAAKLREYVKGKFGSPKVALIGLQPAMLEALSSSFTVRAVDMDEDNIGKEKSGVLVESYEKTGEVLDWCDLIVATGSTAVNATIPDYCGIKPVIFFGTTGSAAAHLMGLERWCHMGH